MIKLDIINEVVNRTSITKTKAEMAVETVFESMKKALAKGDRIELRGFGVFNVKPRKTGIGRNPRTGAGGWIPPGKAVRFKPGKELQSLPPKCSDEGQVTSDEQSFSPGGGFARPWSLATLPCPLQAARSGREWDSSPLAYGR